MKYKVGDSFLLRMTIDSVDDSGNSLTYCMGKEADGMWLSEYAIDKLSAKAAAYAAKAAPAPVSTAWEPKRDEVVLVEMEFVREKAGGEVYVQKGDGNFIAVPRSAIVGPAPKREPGPKFSFGQDALYVPAMEKVIVNHFIGFGKYDVYRMGHESFTAHEDDLLTLDEARERLGKK